MCGNCGGSAYAGCTDEEACNYDPEAGCDDDSCLYNDVCGNCGGTAYAGCTDATACNYDPQAGCEDGSCDYEECAGCTDSSACNFLPNATISDDSCLYDDVCGNCGGTAYAGCTNETACNYDPQAGCDDGSCEFDTCAGCTDAQACNFNAEATISDDSCTYPETFFDCEGNCINDANDDGICDELEVIGCMNPTACNYDLNANVASDDCEFADAFYDCEGNCINDVNENGVCDELEVEGCTDENAVNFNPDATVDDGSCFENCVMPDVTLTANPCNDRGFTVWIEVADLGMGDWLLTNDVSDQEVTVSEVGGWMTPTFGPEDVVTFTLTSTSAATCILTAEPIGCTASLEEQDVLDFEIFPNPTSDSFKLRTPSDRQVEITIFDLTGKVVYNSNLNTNSQGTEISTGNLATGTYMVQIRSDFEIATRRLMIQR